MDPSRPLVRQAVLCTVATVSAVGAVAARPANPPSRLATLSPVRARAVLPSVVVPSVVGEAFVFAKGDLGDAGLAWRVAGPVHGYAANTVVAQSPAAGTTVRDTGAPEITLRLERNRAYAERGAPQDTSPYPATRLAPAR